MVLHPSKEPKDCRRSLQFIEFTLFLEQFRNESFTVDFAVTYSLLCQLSSRYTVDICRPKMHRFHKLSFPFQNGTESNLLTIKQSSFLMCMLLYFIICLSACSTQKQYSVYVPLSSNMSVIIIQTACVILVRNIVICVTHGSSHSPKVKNPKVQCVDSMADIILPHLFQSSFLEKLGIRFFV